MKTHSHDRISSTSSLPGALLILTLLLIVFVLPARGKADTFPPDGRFSGMQTTWTISDATVTETVDSPGFTTYRYLKGTLANTGILTVTGTVSYDVGAPTTTYATAIVHVSVDGVTARWPDNGIPYTVVYNTTKDFSVNVQIPPGAKSGSILIEMTMYCNAGTRGLVVSGAFNASSGTGPPVACTVDCGPMTIIPNPGAVGQNIIFSITPTLTNCTGEKNTYWNFGDGKTSAGLDNFANVPHVYQYDDDFPVTAVFQIVTPTKSYECYVTDEIRIGLGAGGGGGGDPTVKANLRPYVPQGWTDKIVVANRIGTTTDDSPLYTSDILFIDSAVINWSEVGITERFYTSIFLDGNLKHNWYMDELAPGWYAYYKDFILGQLTAGSHTLEIVTDSDDRIAEADETDNRYTKTFQVFPSINPSKLPNLKPYKPLGWSSELVVSTKKGAFKDSLTYSDTQVLYVKWAVINAGSVATPGGFSVTLRVDGRVVKTWSGDALKANYYRSIKSYTIGKLGGGDHTFELVVDSGRAVSESVEYDNTYTKDIWVNGIFYSKTLPDLAPVQPQGWTDKIVVSDSTSGPGGDTFTSKQTLYVDWAVSNLGEGPVPKPYEVDLYLDGELMKTWTVWGLDPGDERTRKDYEIGQLPAGEHTLTVLVDPRESILEENETNNQYNTTIHIDP